MNLINKINYKNLQTKYLSAKPFHHIVIDNFFKDDFALKSEAEFPDFNDKSWYLYDNPIENKKTLNHWDRFPKNTYQAFSYLNNPEFISQIEKLTSISRARRKSRNFGINKKRSQISSAKDVYNKK